MGEKRESDARGCKKEMGPRLAYMFLAGGVAGCEAPWGTSLRCVCWDKGATAACIGIPSDEHLDVLARGKEEEKQRDFSS